MAETNFYSYMFAQAATFAFDELAEIVDLTDPQSIQRAFNAYLMDYKPPLDIQESLLDEQFRISPEDGSAREEHSIRYDILVPGIEENVDEDIIKEYFEEFLEKIGARNTPENKYEVDVSTSDNERGGVNLSIYIAIKGEQIQKLKKGE